MVVVKSLRQVTAQLHLNEKNKDWQPITTHDRLDIEGEYVEVGKHKVEVRISPNVRVRIIDDFDLVQKHTLALMTKALAKLTPDSSLPRVEVCYRHITVDGGPKRDFGPTVEEAKEFLLEHLRIVGGGV